MIGFLPKSLEIDGEEYKIDSDFRTALLIMQMYNDRALSPIIKHHTMLDILFTTVGEDGELTTSIPDNTEEAAIKAMWFLNIGKEEDDGRSVSHQTIDYKQDEQLLFPAVNQAYSGREVRAERYMHWWTFYGLCQSIDENSLLANVISIRVKRANGEKLEKHERDFYLKNRDIIDLKTLTESRLDMGEEYVRQIKSGRFNFRK